MLFIPVPNNLTLIFINIWPYFAQLSLMNNNILPAEVNTLSTAVVLCGFIKTIR